ncbi:cyclase dehydrase [Methylobacterium sp. A54F]
MRYEGPRSRRPGHPDEATDRLARGLGWFSIGLGLAELLAGRSLARGLGLERHTELIRAYGVREIGTGVGILTADDPTPWIWGRVAGDALDLATLGTGLTRRNPRLDGLTLALAAVAGVTVVDALCARALSGETRQPVRPPFDYTRRSGYPRGLAASRGAARDFVVPEGVRTPDLLRAYAA